jgi:hypothetical protein
LQRVVHGLVFELRGDHDHADAAERGLNRLLAISLKKLVAQYAVALNLRKREADTLASEFE